MVMFEEFKDILDIFTVASFEGIPVANQLLKLENTILVLF